MNSAVAQTLTPVLADLPAQRNPRVRSRMPDLSADQLAALPTVLRRVYAGRGVRDVADYALDLAQLLSPHPLLGIDAAATVLDQAIQDGSCIVIAGDYDADGATATAVAILGLRALGAARVDYVVPNRFTMGYGLSEPLVQLAAAKAAKVLVTVDNGISSVAGVAAAKAAGMRVVITDHHLAGPQLPDADAIVNPNQPGCNFPSKHLAGVGVMFYVLLALRARMRARGALAQEPNLAELLDLVAVGTVADLVRLDHNNRILVEQGLRRIRAGRARPGLQALLEIAGRQAAHLRSSDLGFAIGPRLNAAGRLDDMTVGIECLIAPDVEAARPLAAQLDSLNRQRRGIELQMRDDALMMAEDVGDAVGVSLFDASWHEGVVGLVASKIKDRLHRPVVAFAAAQQAGILKGSGRSIPGLHLRDVLAQIDAANPGLIDRFGGHAMAAGLTLPAAHLDAFRVNFDAVCRSLLDDAALSQLIETDGALAPDEFNIETARLLDTAGPWGQGFPEPTFDNEFVVIERRSFGADGAHRRYKLRCQSGSAIDAIEWNAEPDARGSQMRAVYRLFIDRYRGLETPSLQIVHRFDAG